MAFKRVIIRCVGPLSWLLALMNNLVTPLDALASLLTHCESFSKQMLVEHGQFHPFGAFINERWEMELLGADLGDNGAETAPAYQALFFTLSSLAKEGKARAYAIAANVDIPKELESPVPDAIRIQAEAPGYSRFIYTPYRYLPYQGLRKFLVIFPLVEYRDTIAVDIEPQAFG